MLAFRFSVISITIIRLLFVFDVLSLDRILYYRVNQIVVQSVLINPIYTTDHILEANAIRQLRNNYSIKSNKDKYERTKSLLFLPKTSFWKAYEGNQIHIPPIILAFLEFVIHPIKSVASNYWFHVIIKVLVTCIDLIIAYQLESLARKLIHYEDNIETSEAILMKQMDPRILPEYMSLFPNVSDRPYFSANHDHDGVNDNKWNQITGSITHLNNETGVKMEYESEDKIENENKLEDVDESKNEQPVIIALRHEIPLVIAKMYYMSPITILSSSSLGSFQNMRLLFLVCSLNQSIVRNNEEGSMTLTAYFLAMASYTDIHFILFLLPAIFFFKKTTSITKHQRRREDVVKDNNEIDTGNCNDWKLLLLLFMMYFVSFHVMSYKLVYGIWKDVIISTHLYSFQLNCMEPNLSTLWYMGMELFHRFRLYFTILLGGIPYILIIPITLRFYDYPAVLMAIFWMMGVLFRPPSTLYDLNVSFCLMMYSSMSLIRIPKLILLICLFAIPIPVLLYLVSYWMWIGPNSGEANFLYFQCLVYNIFVSLLLLLFTSASLKRDKALRVTQKRIRIQQHPITIASTSEFGDGNKETY